MNNELYHYGIKGMKWGVRRYQNEDGSLTDAGKARYRVNVGNIHGYSKIAGKKLVTTARHYQMAKAEKEYKAAKKKRDRLREMDENARRYKVDMAKPHTEKELREIRKGERNQAIDRQRIALTAGAVAAAASFAGNYLKGNPFISPINSASVIDVGKAFAVGYGAGLITTNLNRAGLMETKGTKKYTNAALEAVVGTTYHGSRAAYNAARNDYYRAKGKKASRKTRPGLPSP